MTTDTFELQPVSARIDALALVLYAALKGAGNCRPYVGQYEAHNTMLDGSFDLRKAARTILFSDRYALEAVLMERERVLALCGAQLAIYDAKIDEAMKDDDIVKWDRLDCYKDAVENIAATIRKGQP